MNKRGDRKVESNDSPEISDRKEASDIPSLPSGVMVCAVLPPHFPSWESLEGKWGGKTAQTSTTKIKGKKRRAKPNSRYRDSHNKNQSNGYYITCD